MSRRGFLAGCAACAGAGLALPGRAAGQAAGADAAGKAKVRLVFTTVPNNRPIWPNIGYDFEKRKKQILDVLIPGCRQVAFEVAEVQNAQQAVKLLKDDEAKGFDGYLVFMLGLWTRAPQAIAAAANPRCSWTTSTAGRASS